MKTYEEWMAEYNEKIVCEKCGNDNFIVYKKRLSSGNKLVCVKCKTENIRGRPRIS
jgi:ribosomal protein L40E